MLGELITEERGKVTGRRILDSQAGKMETSFTAMGKVKGAEGMDMGKYLRECHSDKKMIGRFAPNLCSCFESVVVDPIMDDRVLPVVCCIAVVCHRLIPYRRCLLATRFGGYRSGLASARMDCLPGMRMADSLVIHRMGPIL